MLFSSFTFLFFFLPALLFFYFLPPFLFRLWGKGKKPFPLSVQNGILVVASLLFYSWGAFSALPLLLFAFAVAYLGARAVSLFPKWRKPAFFLSLFLLFLPLLSFKLAVFFPFFHFPPLPLGISFYTFTATAYLADVYRGKEEAEKNPLVLAAFLSFFPSLLSGPILRFAELREALSRRRHTVKEAADGISLFLCGLAKKAVLAAPAGAIFNTVMGDMPQNITFLSAWLAFFAFPFQLYFDFSGYTDMARGLGLMFALPLPQNFQYPYEARGITDFWRRWHITLSLFFRDYVYFPLGGSRKGAARTVGNLLVVWLLTGLWHGVGCGFLLWGLYHFLLLFLEKFPLRPVAKRLPPWLSRCITFLLVSFGWLLFAFDGSSPARAFPQLGGFLGALLGKNGFARGADLYDALRHIPFFLLLFLGATPLPHRFFQRLSRRHFAFSLLLALCAFFLSLAYLSNGSFCPFLYFQF